MEYRFEADRILWYVRHVRLRESLCAPFDADLHLITRAEVSTSGVLGMEGVLPAATATNSPSRTPPGPSKCTCGRSGI